MKTSTLKARTLTWLTVVVATLGLVAVAPIADSGTAAAATATGTPLVIGNVGSYTAPNAANGVAVGKQAIQAWAKWVNSHGGVNGHPVKLIIKDDKGDQGQAIAAVKELVEQDHVAAFVSNQDGSLVSGYGDYLKQQGIPVLGGNLYTLDWITNPVLYPQGITVIQGTQALVDVAKNNGYKKIGAIACSEAVQCSAGNSLIKSNAQKAGIDFVYNGLVSSTAPDYTATCLAAKSAGADILALLIPTADEGNKIAADCARQNYKPGWDIPGEAIGPGYTKTNAFNNAYNASGVQPWFSKDKSMKDYQAAMKKYSNINFKTAEEPLLSNDAWVSGLMLQQAVKNSAATGLPTTQDIINGLAKFDNETLGGLTGGLTFTNNSSKAQYCYFTIKIQNQKFVLPDGTKPSCVAQS